MKGMERKKEAKKPKKSPGSVEKKRKENKKDCY